MTKLIPETEIDAPIELVGGKAKGLLKVKPIEEDVCRYVHHGKAGIPSFFVVPDDVNLKDYYHEIIETSKQLGSSYAVRSSSPLEDVGEHSFDGIFLTELNVPKEKLVRTIHNVRKSALSDRARAYAQDVGVELDGKMPVIVQVMANKHGEIGVVYSKFPCPNDIVKVIQDYGTGRIIEAFSRKPIVKHFEYPDVGNVVIPARSYSTWDLFKETEDVANIAVAIERELGYPIIMEFSACGFDENREVDILQARRLTNLSEAEKFQMPELQKSGLVASTDNLNGVGDVTGEAFVIDFAAGPVFDGYELEAFDKSHEKDGYILVTPYLQYYPLEFDPMTPNKKATVAYNDLGSHHDFEVARKKGLLYLLCAPSLWMTYHRSGYEGEGEPPIKTGDKLRVISDGEKGYIFKL